ncbi:hypothetical protein FRC12_008217 [Ceratobasidium sp. 428]|nr:hypothetical protein FRC12_008217 [Ceratobasidium sp. 428]
MAKEYQTGVYVTLGGSELRNICMSIGGFQETYIKQRIAAHAKRVDTHQLASAPLVIEDIEETMSEVWKGLPLGWGAVALNPLTE